MLIRRNAVEVWHISDFLSQPLDRIRLFVCLFVAIKPEKLYFASCVGRKVNPRGVITGFWFLVCYAATQLATPLHQRRIQVVRRNNVAQKRLTESNGTPAMDFGCEEIRKRKRRIEQSDSWSLSHLGYLYPGTIPVMIKLDHNRSCPWV